MNSLLQILFFGALSLPGPRNVTALIDTGLTIPREQLKYLCTDQMYDLTRTTIRDTHGHGTMMFNLISNSIDHTKSCISIIKYCNTCQGGESGIYQKIYNALKIAQKIPNLKYINMSLSIPYDYSDEKEVIQALLDRGVTFSIAAGNESADLNLFCDRYPACYFKNNAQFHVLGALNETTNTKESYSNYGDYVTNWEKVKPGGGTSSAAAIFTNKLIRGLEK